MDNFMQLVETLSRAAQTAMGKSSITNGARCHFGEHWRGLFLDRFEFKGKQGAYTLNMKINVITREHPNILPAMQMHVEFGDVRVICHVEKVGKFHKKNRDHGYQPVWLTAHMSADTVREMKRVSHSENEVRAILASLNV